MSKALKIVIGFFGVTYIMIGLLWWIAPSFVAPQLGMSLSINVGLSTQIADFASFFMVLGLCILISLKTNKLNWLYPSLMLLSIACLGRILSWIAHGATLALDMIAVELTTIIFLSVYIKMNNQNKINL